MLSTVSKQFHRITAFYLQIWSNCQIVSTETCKLCHSHSYLTSHLLLLLQLDNCNCNEAELKVSFKPKLSKFQPHSAPYYTNTHQEEGRNINMFSKHNAGNKKILLFNTTFSHFIAPPGPISQWHCRVSNLDCGNGQSPANTLPLLPPATAQSGRTLYSYSSPLAVPSCQAP